jgi:hypothetical protein
VKNDDLQWFRDCIRERANIDARDNSNWIPYAAEKGYAELVNYKIVPVSILKTMERSHPYISLPEMVT